MFGSNVQPKKVKKETQSWVCGCNKQMPHYILYCPKCQKGQ